MDILRFKHYLDCKAPEATAVYARLNLDPVRKSVEKATTAMLALKEAPEQVIKLERGEK